MLKYFARKKQNIELKILVGFGIVIGLSALGLNSLFDDSFGASTPVNIRTENLTDKNLKIYAIAFWSKNWNGTENYVTYDKELKPNGKSDFWFENDGTTEFWIVAKSRNGAIEYLKVIKEQNSEYDLEITETKNITSDKIQIAEELTFKTDKKERMEKYVIWLNIGLIGLLILSLIKIETGGNTV
ncbi:hypothetical protein BTO06_12355 [Tenacibaculum sp. SZ-18]|nr:hypothetical protein BTO06_12355 [Tenacibaculum sp. SZ-18]